MLGGFESVSGKATHWPSLVRNTKLFIAFGGLAMPNSQVETRASPRKPAIRSTRAQQTSCTTSSASWREPVMRQAMRCIRS